MTDTTAETPSDIILEIGSKVRAGASVTYGDPIELGDATIVPVAASWYGFGGGTDKENQGGGGGGSLNIPLGGYVARDGKTSFELNEAIELALVIPIIAVSIWGTVKILQALKR